MAVGLLKHAVTTFFVWKFACTNQRLVTPSSAWCKNSSAKSSEEDEDNDGAFSPGPEANWLCFFRHATFGREPPFDFLHF